MKLIVGLGNPEKSYDNTRHNVGFRVVDNFLGSVSWQEKFHGLVYKTNINNETVCFLKPTTYMNLSGQAVREIVDYYNIDVQDILIIQDDLDEPFGEYKLKMRSGHGGHNGIKSIINMLGTDAFPRLKIGIGSVQKDEVIDYVLGKFSKDEQKALDSMSDTFNEIIDSFIKNGIERTMNIYNTK